MRTQRTFELPPSPPHEDGPVKAWRQPVVIPTYPPLPADRNPMFLEKRVYQGSSGAVYPLPFIDRISGERVQKTWEAAHLENDYLRVMVLPEIGGRIHVGFDKTTGYDFFYRQNVIKPALVGLAGPWISGGVEFNWPQHHRPATFMPVSTSIEENADGSRTIWCSDHDPMNRLKGMHGVTLHPGKAYIELKVRLYNRTPFVQTFLWWANVAARVHERYQSFFPPDVHYVADHAKRAISRFPVCSGSYYGVDYAERALQGTPADERPRDFVPPGGYSAADLSWYANIPVPTSYMAIGSDQDFFGGYDHAAEAGLIHFANHHIAPGKKQWTWGNHDFGYCWDRHLTDADGPYIELMAGVYTDNQPDFSFLAPGETKTFSQYWYPIRRIGPAQQANLDAAVSLQTRDGAARVGVCVSGEFPDASVELRSGGQAVATWKRDLAPETPLIEQAVVEDPALELSVHSGDGRELIRYSPRAAEQKAAPEPALEPPAPREIPSADELYLTGLHLEQYRHATRRPEEYWQEALRRDPEDARCNNALGLWRLRRGEFTAAEQHFRTAVARLTRRNPNPYDGEPYYNLGLTLRFLGRDDDAYSAFYKATWNQAWQAAGYHALAEIDAGKKQWTTALDHVDRALRVNSDNLKARDLKAAVLQKLDRTEEADALVQATLELDPLDFWARRLAGCSLRCDNQVRLDMALDMARAGLFADAVDVLQDADATAQDGSVPMVRYTLAFLQQEQGSAADALWDEAACSCPDYCFPNRLEEIGILESAMRANPGDARAPYYLGNLLYARRRCREAIALWEKAAELDASYPVVWRNLGIGYFNVMHKPRKALQAFDCAVKAAPGDARVLYERDQLWKRTGATPSRRLTELERRADVAHQRDDLAVEMAALHNQTGAHERALALLKSRQFQPWEGGEGLVLEQYVRTHLALGRKALSGGKPREAKRLFAAALRAPHNIGEAAHLLANRSHIYYWLGIACAAGGEESMACEWWRKAAQSRGDFREMRVQTFSDMTYYEALAMRQLGRIEEARQLLADLLAHAGKLSRSKAKVDYFATSLPAMLLFEDDLQKRQSVEALFLQAQARFGLGQTSAARKLLSEVLALDRNHAMAADLLAELAHAQ